MRWIMVVFAMIGVVVSLLALREHYRTDTSPCSINDRWDCGIVNRSPYAKVGQVPVAAIGIGGYLLLGGLAWKRAYRLMLAPVVAGLLFSLYLTRIEARILGVYCVYCVISLGVICVLTLLVAERVIWTRHADRAS